MATTPMQGVGGAAFSNFLDLAELADSLGTDSLVRELSDSIPFEHVHLPHGLEDEVVWRRSSLARDSNELALGFLERPRLTKCGDAFLLGPRGGPCDSTAIDGNIVPGKPIHIMRTNFSISSMSAPCLSCCIQQVLDLNDDVTCQFNTDTFTWDCLYLRGSSQCKFTISIYAETRTTVACGVKQGNFIVEANRLSGDGEGFRLVFQQLKRLICQIPFETADSDDTSLNILKEQRSFDAEDALGSEQEDSSSSVLSGTMPPIPSSSMLPTDVLSDTQAAELLLPLLDLARLPSPDAQVLVSKILCDITQNESMQQALCDSGCIDALVRLAAPSANSVARRHAFVALAHLSVSLSCQEMLIDAGVLPVALALAADNSISSQSFDMREVKREAARIIANLSARFGARVVSSVGSEALTTWIDSVETIDDERLKLHAERAKSLLSEVLA